ncbi:L-amino acid N-acyltransferase YncA [Halobacillus karajensis]|uniref:Ribosomal-protein-alanine N-acetyltransferase n=1 Tax=Halobacillus karajensis TaxID=195088 RepID=A0A024P9Z6_9BACI|nr:GNAT family N-acetyltransferase [Halobacillus karajensis]CDQ21257.1 ribosomal-protein-alanine N-acetyltransferase [Halobacillus karajensis]CDQ25673.1 ribosomal-protein-alanine N-acetyltransferase [Halobacillus karajensis]CDQ25944.1 ribosomal-protein-alanine N-acetyltransferase [Halobacillus karajensis]SEI10120.1 L-amino acid N-acyltransferase YncA [Halobacillus karajensis]
MKIRKATVTDAEGVAKVQVDSWHSTYKNIIPDEYLRKMTYESWGKKWKEIISKQSVYIAEDNKGKIIGFSNGGPERTGKYPGFEGELYAIYILKDHQRKGLGKQLLEPIIQELENQGIYSMLALILEDNHSRFFYEKVGAEKVDIIEIEFSGKRLNQVVYGLKDIRKIQ